MSLLTTGILVIVVTIITVLYITEVNTSKQNNKKDSIMIIKQDSNPTILRFISADSSSSSSSSETTRRYHRRYRREQELPEVTNVGDTNLRSTNTTACPSSLFETLRIAYVGGAMNYDRTILLEEMIQASVNNIQFVIPIETCLTKTLQQQQNTGISISSTLIAAWNNPCRFMNVEEEKLLIINPDGTSYFETTPDRYIESVLFNNDTTTASSSSGGDGWDYLILQEEYVPMNGQQQIMDESIRTIIAEKYAPTLKLSGRRRKTPSDLTTTTTTSASNIGQQPTIPILVQIPAPYMDVGVDVAISFDQITDLIATTIKGYAALFDEILLSPSPETTNPAVRNKIARIAPVGEAFRYIYNNHPELYKKLYISTDLDSTKTIGPYGMYLYACVLYLTLFPEEKNELPSYNVQWWTKTSIVNLFDNFNSGEPIPSIYLPTIEEANKLHDVAIRMTSTSTTTIGISSSQDANHTVSSILNITNDDTNNNNNNNNNSNNILFIDIITAADNNSSYNTDVGNDDDDSNNNNYTSNDEIIIIAKNNNTPILDNIQINENNNSNHKHNHQTNKLLHYVKYNGLN